MAHGKVTKHPGLRSEYTVWDFLDYWLEDTQLTRTARRVLVALWRRSFDQHKDLLDDLRFKDIRALAGVRYNKVLARAVDQLVRLRAVVKKHRPGHHPGYAFSTKDADRFLKSELGKPKAVKRRLLYELKVTKTAEFEGPVIALGDALPYAVRHSLVELVHILSKNPRVPAVPIILDLGGYGAVSGSPVHPY
jgi:hypothetical protein